MAILAVNAGSSSLKFSLHQRQGNTVLPGLMSGCIQGLEPGGAASLDWTVAGHHQSRPLQLTAADRFTQALHCLDELLTGNAVLPRIEAIAHRVVHGGEQFCASVFINDEVLSQLDKLCSLAPLHQPQNLQGIRAFRQAFPSLLQVACFDTAFHATLPEVDYRFALPEWLTAQGVRRYGFHGLSYQYVMGALQQHSTGASGRVLMAHLGNGASLCAAMDGRSCATSMGFSALDGLMMGTRCGSLDAGVVLYLLRQGWDFERLQTLLYQQSGLLGVSGISADMRNLRANGSAAALRAIAQFTHRIVRESGALVACMGGLDVLSFSGGIGEHDAVLRAQVCEQLAWLGVQIDPALNLAATGQVTCALHGPRSRVQIWLIPTDEGLVAAREAARLLQGLGTPLREDAAGACVTPAGRSDGPQ